MNPSIGLLILNADINSMYAVIHLGPLDIGLPLLRDGRIISVGNCLVHFVQPCYPRQFSRPWRFAEALLTRVAALLGFLRACGKGVYERTITEEIPTRANEAIGRGEAKGPRLDQCWKRFEKLNGGIVGPKSWEQIKKIAEAPLELDRRSTTTIPI